eukprot:2625818-Amphidinium_carterae.1
MVHRHFVLSAEVSLLSGAVAGVVSSIVSQPADTVLSKMNQASAVVFQVHHEDQIKQTRA